MVKCFIWRQEITVRVIIMLPFRVDRESQCILMCIFIVKLIFSLWGSHAGRVLLLAVSICMSVSLRVSVSVYVSHVCPRKN